MRQAMAPIGASPRLPYKWIWRVKNNLPVSNAARDFVRRLTRVGSRSLRISDRDLREWLQAQRGNVRTRQPTDELGEVVNDLQCIGARLRELGRDAEGSLADGLVEILKRSAND